MGDRRVSWAVLLPISMAAIGIAVLIGASHRIGGHPSDGGAPLSPTHPRPSPTLFGSLPLVDAWVRKALRLLLPLPSLLAQTITKMTSAAAHGTRQVGAKYSLAYRCYLKSAAGKIVSPFHDVPLFHDEARGILNMVVEVPRFSNAKLEISKDELMNPIKQDVKKGALRYVKNCFPYHGYLWNYGAFPQTWESPAVIDPHTQLKGDNDPIDVIEIGSAVAATGQVKQVKVLGALAMLDEGETDWKIIAIDVNDPLAPQLEDASDLDRVCPGLVAHTRAWFEGYKVPDGKPFNAFAFDGAVQDRAFALRVIQETHHMWRQLISGAVPSKTDAYDVSIVNREAKVGPQINDDDLKLDDALPDAAIPDSVHGWAYIPPKPQ